MEKTTIICATYGEGDASDPAAAVLYAVRHTCADPLHAIKEAARECVALMADQDEPWPHSSFNIGDALDNVPPDMLLSYGLTAFFQINVRPDIVIALDNDLLGHE